VFRRKKRHAFHLIRHLDGVRAYCTCGWVSDPRTSKTLPYLAEQAKAWKEHADG